MKLYDKINDMKSEMGRISEQPNNEEEIMENKEEKIPEKLENIESYDKEEWEKLKQSGPTFANIIDKGKEMGVPQEELDRLAQDIIARETENQDYYFVYRFRKSMKIGTEEEIRAIGEQAYNFLLEVGYPESAIWLAEEIYGKDSEEWKRANEMNETKRKKIEEKIKKEEEIEDEEKEFNISISKDATFADLFDAIDAIEEKIGLGELHFEEELSEGSGFDSETVEKIFDFRDTQADKAETTKVLDFFKERGYTQSDVVAFLPIKFKQERKKKEK